MSESGLTVGDQTITVDIAAAAVEKPQYGDDGIQYESQAEHLLLLAARRLVELRAERFEREREERERTAAENRQLRRGILGLLSGDEVTALNAAGLADAVTRIAAGLNAGSVDGAYVSVRIEEKERNV